MKNVLVALWSYPSNENYDTLPMAGVKSFTDCVQDTARQLAATRDIETQNPFHAICIAPEYLFVGGRKASSHVANRRRAMSSEDKNKVVVALKGVSKANPKILIIAGSTFWCELLNTDERRKKFNANLIAAALKKTDFAMNADPDAGRGMAYRGAKIVELPGLDTLAKDKPDYRAYNTLYAFLNGASAFAPYSKECDFFEAGDGLFLQDDGGRPKKLAYVPGSAGGVREVGNFRFGVEICFDHANNMMKGKDADFHIIVSDSVATVPTQNIGGYLLHASSDCSETGVWKSGATRLAAVNNEVPTPYSLTYWLVPIAARP